MKLCRRKDEVKDGVRKSSRRGKNKPGGESSIRERECQDRRKDVKQERGNRQGTREEVNVRRRKSTRHEGGSQCETEKVNKSEGRKSIQLFTTMTEPPNLFSSNGTADLEFWHLKDAAAYRLVLWVQTILEPFIIILDIIETIEVLVIVVIVFYFLFPLSRYNGQYSGHNYPNDQGIRYDVMLPLPGCQVYR
ncbi:hypothetical protein Btru_014485 [Bulinus truncatus]|nr:hypothetical protein Btru_014485 [Bulinus truncatus]